MNCPAPSEPMQLLHQVREVSRLAQSLGFTVDGEVVLAISDSHGYGGLSFEVAEQRRTDRGGEMHRCPPDRP
jgi:hypothetical protein